MTTKRCIKCQVVKSISEFNNNSKKRGGLKRDCKKCQQLYAGFYASRGLAILQSFATQKGCCNHCQLPYHDEVWHFFEFDHIDPNLKKHIRETQSKWIASHQQEFFQRVAPNLQLLCVRCHKLKSSEEMKLGGSVHQKMQGRSQPAQVIQRDLTLFDSSLILELGEEYSLHTREGEWLTVRDIDGNLIRYEPLSNLKKH